MQVIQKDLAAILGMSPRRIRQLTDEQKVFVKNAEGRYDVAQCVQSYINFKVSAETSRGNDLDYWGEKAKHENTKRKMSDMQLARMKRESFDAADVEEAWAVLVLAFKDELESLPHKLAPLLVGIEDMAEADRIIEAEINSALEVLSQFDVDKIESREDLTEEDEDEAQPREVPPPDVRPNPARKKAKRKPVGGRKP
jgi:phage terminase Nu1 subunit (DNA packaging protein)